MLGGDTAINQPGAPDTLWGHHGTSCTATLHQQLNDHPGTPVANDFFVHTMAFKMAHCATSQFTIPTGPHMAPTATDCDDGGSMYLQNISIIVHMQQLITMEA
jgi:hypothetical protein